MIRFDVTALSRACCNVDWTSRWAWPSAIESPIRCIVGNAIAANVPIIAMTTTMSVNVKPFAVRSVCLTGRELSNGIASVLSTFED